MEYNMYKNKQLTELFSGRCYGKCCTLQPSFSASQTLHISFFASF